MQTPAFEETRPADYLLRHAASEAAISKSRLSLAAGSAATSPTASTPATGHRRTPPRPSSPGSPATSPSSRPARDKPGPGHLIAERCGRALRESAALGRKP